ncbi:hypothetical protein AHAS_Ahas02G0199400 [Arachis hypogaea]
MCRGRRMFTLMKIWRHKINVNHKGYVVIFAVAASVILLLVVARSHRIDTVPNLSLIVSDDAEVLRRQKNNQCLKIHTIHLGKKKMHNSRYISRRNLSLCTKSNDLRLLKSFETFLVLKLQT